MHMTRRTFLGYAAGAVTSGLRGLPGTRVDGRPVVLLHLSQHSSESVAGYTGTLANSGTRFLHAEPSSVPRSEEHTSELQSRLHLVCRLLLEKKKTKSSDENVR